MLKTLRCFTAIIFSFIGCAMFVQAQSATATLSGTVVDEQGALVSGASVKITDQAKAFERSVTTNDEGFFSFAQLAPSDYVLSVAQSGFATSNSSVVLNVNDQSSIKIQLKVAGADEFVNVEAPIITESPAVSTVIDRQFIENQPLNGRSFQNLVELSPGVIIAPSNLPNPGQFSVNGQRTGSNYFTVDGVSANFGSTASVTLYETAGGGVPLYSALGTTSSLASVDAVQEFSIQTSTYAPEFGRQPGAQISLVTRSGTNEYHGSVFDYVRNDVFDANNFFDNANSFEKQALRQNDFGGTFGGPLPFLNFGEGVPVYNSGKDRTFFFLSYEGLRLRSPGRTDNDLEVPTATVRNNATGVLRDILHAFPLPNRTFSAAEEADGVVPYFSNFTNPSRLDAISLRIDHKINDRFSIFGRYNYAPSEDQQRARFCAASCVADLIYKTQTFTAGSTQIFSPRLSNDLRVNFSKSKVNQTYFIDDFGGAIVPPQSSLYPSFTNRNSGYFYFEVNPTGSNTLSDGLFSDNKQRQFNIVNTTSYSFSGHALKFGVDYRRLTPVSFSGTYKRAFLPDSIQDVINNVPTFAQIIAPQVILRPIYHNFSVFAQDTWRVNPRLTLTYGLRYEVVPAPDEENGNLPLTVLGLQEGANSLANLSLSPTRQRFYETTYNNFAPRVGAAYQIFDKTIVRGGFGVFYDLGYGFTGSAFSMGILPFSNTLTLPSVTYDSPAFQQQVPPVSLNPPYSRVFAYQPNFKLPYTLEYNVAVEQAFGKSNTISISYVGANGRRLGRVETLRASTGNFRRLELVTNGGFSNYNALQAQYQRRFSRGLQALVSYTFGKSLDNVSEETQNNLQSPTGRFDPRFDYGASSFDVRHAFNGAISYEIPSPFKNNLARKIFGGFGIDAIFRARTATPVNLVSGANSLGLGVTTILRPDLVPNQPIYI
ncbi:MAG: TonB-dependent receptor, partial [Acidobacteriota bacterium]